MYITLLNICASIHRQCNMHAYRLIGYLPIPVLDGLTDKEKATHRLEIFHYCMSKITEPLVKAGRNGKLMRRSDGSIINGYPVLMSFIADNPEQCRVACCKQNACPTCVVDPNERGQNTRLIVHRDRKCTLTALREDYDEPGSSYVMDDDNLRSCYPPFWQKLPHTDIFRCFTPDLLHQIHKGVFKSHVFQWSLEMAEILGHKNEIDRRFITMTDHPAIRRFSHGVSTIKQWTGAEAKAIMKVFVGVIAGLLPPRAVRAVRAIIDFMYIASYHSHSESTLVRLQEALDEFHENKGIFIEMGIRDHFNFNKLHMLQHYVHMIKLLGTTDGYNTEATERLHLDLAKNLYRASNKKDYMKQMTEGLQRHEQMRLFRSYIRWRKIDDENVKGIAYDDELFPDGENDSDIDNEDNVDIARSIKNDVNLKTSPWMPSYRMSARYSLAKHASWSDVTPDELSHFHGAGEFIPALRKYIAESYPFAAYLPNNNDTFHIFKRLYISLTPLNGIDETIQKDVVRATPRRGKKGSRNKFDTVLVHENANAETVGIEGKVYSYECQS